MFLTSQSLVFMYFHIPFFFFFYLGIFSFTNITSKTITEKKKSSYSFLDIFVKILIINLLSFTSMKILTE